jgi:hypothetical protein
MNGKTERLCKDCKHASNQGFAAQCLHPNNMRANHVTGGKEPVDYCSAERTGPQFLAFLFGQCGPSGANWEAR